MDTQHIYVLGVGINSYSSGDITDLEQCEKDIERVDKFFKKKLKIPNDNICLLSPKKTKRADIIHAFRTHFSKLGRGDIAVFYYSGHGSWERPGKEFIEAKIESSTGTIESLVPKDARENGVRNIADKELRMLIHELQFDEHGNDKEIQFISILDCCHSGSMMKMEVPGMKARRDAGPRDPRPLPAFLDGKYDPKKLSLPKVNYISLTASSSSQVSVETEAYGGLFTYSFITALNRFISKGITPSYAELFSTTKSILKGKKFREINKQTPQIEFSGNISPYDSFLGLGPKKLVNLPELVFRDGKWKIGLGAIHGMEVSDSSTQTIKVFEEELEGEERRLKEVGLVIPEELQVEYTVVRESKTKLSPSKTYYAEFPNKLLPIVIIAGEGQQAVKTLFTNELQHPPYRSSFSYSEQTETEYKIQISADTLEIWKEGDLLYGVRDHSPEAVKHICDWLVKLARWEMLDSLQNPTLNSIGKDAVKLVLEYYDYDDTKVRVVNGINETDPQKTYEVRVPYNPGLGGLEYTFEVENTYTRDIYFYLVKLDRFYGITQLHEDYHKAFSFGDDLQLGKVPLYDSFRKKVFGISGDSKEVKTIFLLIASREPLVAPYALEQEGLNEKLGKIVSAKDWREKLAVKKREEWVGDGAVPAARSMKANWMVIRMEVLAFKEEPQVEA